jgi:hypothetical protein
MAEHRRFSTRSTCVSVLYSVSLNLETPSDFKPNHGVFFGSFQQFFESTKVDGAAPNMLGFEGFFRGAYSYHFHNFWCVLLVYLRVWIEPEPVLFTSTLGGFPLTRSATTPTSVHASLKGKRAPKRTSAKPKHSSR